jgi:hypothetical protein
MYLAYANQLLAFFHFTYRIPRFIQANPWDWILAHGSFVAMLVLFSLPLGFSLGQLFHRVERTLKPHPLLCELCGYHCSCPALSWRSYEGEVGLGLVTVQKLSR